MKFLFLNWVRECPALNSLPPLPKKIILKNAIKQKAISKQLQLKKKIKQIIIK